jgi:uncharacterized membrane protein YfcA
MNILEITPLILALSFGAGFLGSLTGLGGGVIVIPALTLLFGVDIHYAIGASLVSVIATSSGAAAAYVREGFTNIRIGMFLESATTVGALLGASLAAILPEAAISVIFGVVLVFSGVQTLKSHEGDDGGDGRPLDKIATFLRMHSSYPSPEGSISYHVRRVPGGMALMMVAGGLSGLLGLGSGAFKVLAMDRVMRIPFKVSTTTSNFMIGVTAAASAGVYLNRGYVDPGLAMPVMLGVLAGSLFGARVLAKSASKTIRIIFVLLILALAIEMIYEGLVGKI